MSHIAKRFVALLILLSIAEIWGCSHGSKSFYITSSIQDRQVQFKQHVFSKGSYYRLTMGNPDWPGCSGEFYFTFNLDDASAIHYAYVSIETYDVGQACSSVFLNDHFVTCLEWNRGMLYPDVSRTTQTYLPIDFFRPGRNILKIKASRYDRYEIHRFDIVVITMEELAKQLTASDQKTQQKYFPENLSFIKELTDEELYIAIVKLPLLVEELNFRQGMYKKKLSFIYSKIGDFYRYTGNYLKNLMYQKKAVHSDQKEGLTALTPYLKTRLGLAYYYMGNYSLAVQQCLEAENTRKQLSADHLKDDQFVKRNPLYIEYTIKAYLSLFYYHLNKFDLAAQYAQGIIDSRGKNLRSMVAPVAESIKNKVLGDIEVNKNTPKAIEYYKQGIEKITGIKSLRWNAKIFDDVIMNLQLSIANAQFKLNDFAQSRETLSLIDHPTHEYAWRSHLLQGKMFEIEKNLINAAESFYKAIEEIEFSRSNLASHGFKITFMNDKQEPYARMISVLVGMGKKEKAFEYVEKAKARAFIDLIANSSVAIRLKNDEIKSLTENEKKLRQKLLDLQVQSNSQKDISKERGPTSHTTREIEKAQRELDRFYQKEAFQNMDFASLKTVDTLKISDLQKYLTKEISIIEYFYDNQNLYAWYIDKNNVKLVTKPLKIGNLENSIKIFRDCTIKKANLRGVDIVDSNYETYLLSASQYDSVNNKLVNTLVRDVLDTIQTSKVYIVPHGALHLLPFQALQHNSQYLIEKYQIGYLPSATALKYVLAKRKEKQMKILAFGNPELENKTLALPYAEKEVKGIKQIYPFTKILTRENASEAALKSMAATQDIIHIASHGEFNSQAPLLSCLRLSEGNGEDGRLETREIFGLELKTYLVTLSACNTAMGKLTQGDEVVGLSRAFIFAGTPSILGTVWSVNDASTSVLMNQFYRNLSKMDKFEALQKAQISMLRGNTYPQPYFWAPFQLIGDYY